jgi:hypothetical protein
VFWLPRRAVRLRACGYPSPCLKAGAFCRISVTKYHYSHEPPGFVRGLASRNLRVEVCKPVVSSLSAQWRRPPRAGTPLEGSWDRQTLLQSDALPSRVKSPAGVGTVLWTQQAFPTWARRAVRESPPGLVRQPLTGSSPLLEKKGPAMVFVLDQKKHPLMPCTRHPGATPAQARPRRGASGAAVRHSPQRPACGRR